VRLLTQPPPLASEVRDAQAADIEAMRGRDRAENGGKLVLVFSSDHGDARYAQVRAQGEALALRSRYGAPLSEAEQHTLSVIRTVRAIASAEHSKRNLEANVASQEELKVQMPFLASTLESGLSMTREAVEAQDEIIGQESAALASLLRRG
jgi:hypothetical protein